MAHTKGWAILLILLTTALTSVAQILYKIAAPRLPEIITNWPLLGGIACYAFGALLMIVSFSGGEVSVLYPLFATSYIWVTLAAWLLFAETLSPLRIAGLILVVIGVSVIGIGSKNNKDKSGKSNNASAVDVEVPP
jgi:drug/metabolite transporter (DMT)-like permease